VPVDSDGALGAEGRAGGGGELAVGSYADDDEDEVSSSCEGCSIRVGRLDE
jgi:hypothetical protein